MRRVAAPVVMFGLLLGLAAACSDDDRPSTGTTSPPFDDEPVDDAAYDAVPTIEVTPSGDVPTESRWYLRADPVGDGDELRVVFLAMEPCEHLDGVDVTETGGVIELTVRMWWNPTTRCVADPAWVSTVVPLDEPLGDREVRDGAQGGDPWIGRIPPARSELAQEIVVPIEYGLLTPDGTAVWTTWSGGACDVLGGTEVEREGDTVAVAVRTGVEDPDQPCTANIVGWWTLVELDEPAAAVSFG